MSDLEWSKIVKLLKNQSKVRIGSYVRCRRFLDAVLWILLRVGGQWRTLPADLGAWNIVFKRFNRWCKAGVWTEVHAQLAKDADLQDVSIDSSVNRAHACAAGAANSNAEAEALGRSRGGFGCKIHAAANALGLPIKFILTGGQAADITQAIPLINEIPAETCLADKGSDSDELTAWHEARAIKVVIPPKSNRTNPRECDWWHYKERHVVECMFGKIKYYRRIATRYEKKLVTSWGCCRFPPFCCGSLDGAAICQQSLV